MHDHALPSLWNPYMKSLLVSEQLRPRRVNPRPATGETKAGTGDNADERYRAPALDKGLDIFELLAATEETLSQAEIAKALSRTPNEIYRMLERLVRRGYVLRTSEDRYALSLKLFGLAHQHAPMRRLVSQALPVMRQFARDTGQSCHLSVYERGGVIVIAQVDAPGYWGLAIRVGAQVDLFNTSSGHVLLAFQTGRERRHMLSEREIAVADGTAVSARLEQELAAIRKRGYEVMESAQTRGVVNLTAPVLGSNRTALAALTCPYIEWVDRTEAPDQETALAATIAAGAALSLPDPPAPG